MPSVIVVAPQGPASPAPAQQQPALSPPPLTFTGEGQPFAIWKTLEKENPKLGLTTLKTEYAADYWQRRQKLIALADYIAAKTKRTRPEESAAAHELAEALKLDRV